MSSPKKEINGQSEKAQRLKKMQEQMHELHKKRNYLSLTDIREALKIEPNSSDSRTFLRDISDAAFLGLVARQDGKCPTCGHSLPEEGLYCLPEFAVRKPPRKMRYAEDDFGYQEVKSPRKIELIKKLKERDAETSKEE